MVSTTRLQRPNEFIINNGTKDLEYPIAFNKNKHRQWRKTKIQIQPGQGELVKTWDSWHSGMGWSRDESREAQYAPPFYESGTVTATHRGYLYPQLAYTSTALATVAAPAYPGRLAQMGDYIYAFMPTGNYVFVYKFDPSDKSMVYLGVTLASSEGVGQPAEFGGYLYLPCWSQPFQQLTTICGDLTAAWYYNGTTYTDNTTTAASDGGTPFTILADHTDDIFYFGAATQFNGVYFDIETAAGSALTMDWEYWNGAAWTDIVGPETDGTTGLTIDGWIKWAAASQTGWVTATSAETSMAGTPPDVTSRFWVRVKTTTATPWTAPTSDWLPIADVWTAPDETGPVYRRAWHMGTAGKLLWRVGDNAATPARYVINSCSADPMTSGNWSDSADYVIGKPGRNINSLAELGRWLYVGKEEGLFGSDSEGNQTNALDFVRNLIASTNCSDTIRWLGTLVTTHKSSLWQHTGVSSRPIGIETLESNVSAVKGGRYTALATAGEWLYAAYFVGTTSYLLAARPGHEDEPPVVWHELLSATTTIIDSMLVDGSQTNAVLWIYARTGASLNNHAVWYITLAQDGSPDPTDTNVTFQAAEALINLPTVDWGVPGTPKHGHMVEIVTGQAKGTGGTVKVYYGWDGATPSTQLGSTITTATKSQCFFAGGNTEKTHWGYRPQIRIGITGHASNVLRVEKVSLYSVARPRMEDGIETTIRVADMLDRARTGEVALSDLDALVNAGVYTVRDPDDPEGGTFYAIIHNLSPYEGQQIERLSGEQLVNVTLRKVKYT